MSFGSSFESSEVLKSHSSSPLQLQVSHSDQSIPFICRHWKVTLFVPVTSETEAPGGREATALQEGGAAVHTAVLGAGAGEGNLPPRLQSTGLALLPGHCHPPACSSLCKQIPPSHRVAGVEVQKNNCHPGGRVAVLEFLLSPKVTGCEPREQHSSLGHSGHCGTP